MPTISMPNAGSAPKRSIFDDDHQGAPTLQKEDVKNKKVEDKGKSQQTTPKEGQSPTQNSGWFGGIWNKFSGKPKNQMILPDDKNPTIVWDPEKKKWVNTDEGEAAQESFVPPPKMADLMSQHQPQQQIQQQPQSATMPMGGITDPMAPIPTMDPQQTVQSQQPKASGLQSNIYKIQRNRTLKKSYVDVFNPSGAPTKTGENIMAPSLPPMPQSGFMMPTPGDASQQSQGFYDPNAFAGNYQQQ